MGSFFFVGCRDPRWDDGFGSRVLPVSPLGLDRCPFLFEGFSWSACPGISDSPVSEGVRWRTSCIQFGFGEAVVSLLRVSSNFVSTTHLLLSRHL